MGRVSLYILTNQHLQHVIYLDANVFLLKVMLTPLQQYSYTCLFDNSIL